VLVGLRSSSVPTSVASRVGRSVAAGAALDVLWLLSELGQRVERLGFCMVSGTRVVVVVGRTAVVFAVVVGGRGLRVWVGSASGASLHDGGHDHSGEGDCMESKEEIVSG
jgi:hypothetical protein